MTRLDEQDEKEKKPEPPALSPATQSLFKARTITLFGEIDQKSAERTDFSIGFGGFSGPDGLGVACRSLCSLLDYVQIDYELRTFEHIRRARGFCAPQSSPRKSA